MTDLRTDIAKAIWSELREDLDKCDLGVEDLHRGDRLWVYADVAHAAAQAEIARLRGALESARSYGSESWATWLISEVDDALDTK